MVDAVGIGYHVVTHLADQGHNVYAFNAGSTAMDSEHFVNAKAEAYWSLRESLQRGAISLAARTMKRLAEIFSDEQKNIETQWDCETISPARICAYPYRVSIIL